MLMPADAMSKARSNGAGMIDLRWLDLIDYLPLILEYLMMGCRAAMIPPGYRAMATHVSIISTAKFQLPLSISWLSTPDGILSGLYSSHDGQFSLHRLASIESFSRDWHAISRLAKPSRASVRHDPENPAVVPPKNARGVSTNPDDPAPNGTGSCPSWPGRQPVPSEAPTRFAREIPSKCRTLQMIPPITSKLNGSPRTADTCYRPPFITQIPLSSSSPNGPRNLGHHDGTQPTRPRVSPAEPLCAPDLITQSGEKRDCFSLLKPEPGGNPCIVSVLAPVSLLPFSADATTDGSMYGSQRTTTETLRSQKIFLVALQVAQVEGKLITVSRRGNKASRERKSRMISSRRILAYQCPVLIPGT
ncbi:uncharacterized protein CLUP02_04267 [Colletotrichum lupini]|uniref:Uncharacterized protein n=1 Tax=Colletotrichum lupini TaxID=145971 RepID=A0A9Q8SKW5_9PEZI|nr:uncharacterized protein CLUP02_04267 [Colletotrichum lupini]UQC78790.1 hypothetical protein CLUP02_04267 [Colletotrichum lupini]